MGYVTIEAVADHLHLSGAFVTIETGKLLRMGLITKLPDRKDRRRVCLRVAPKGWELLSDLAPVQVQVNDVLFDFLTSPQFPAPGGTVDRMVACGDRAISLLDYLSKTFERAKSLIREGQATPETTGKRLAEIKSRNGA